jgi:hypothetical protein
MVGHAEGVGGYPRAEGQALKKKTMQAMGPTRYPNPANLAQRLRRIRNELSLMTQLCDDALERIEKNDGERQQRNA